MFKIVFIIIRKLNILGSNVNKPMLSVDDLIQHCRDKGITFNFISEEDAKRYLSENNNFFKLSSYRKNFSKYTDGVNKGKYEKLDFAYLIELARIDVEVRHILLKMCLDIEHFLKVCLLKVVEENVKMGTEDGYKIVTDFVQTFAPDDFLGDKIKQNQKNPYCRNLVGKYGKVMPIWVFVEILNFGDLKKLIEFYAKKTGWQPPVDFRSLDRVRQIRNAAAHNNCIINDLTVLGSSIKTPVEITKFLSDAGISSNQRKKKLSNARINQIVHLLYLYDTIVKSPNTRGIRISELLGLMDKRMVVHGDYFEGNDILSTTYDFFKKIILHIYSRG